MNQIITGWLTPNAINRLPDHDIMAKNNAVFAELYMIFDDHRLSKKFMPPSMIEQ
jgi:hypothetical protein